MAQLLHELLKAMIERHHLFSTKLNGSFNIAVKSVKKVLRESGFEVISEINFSNLIEDRLGIKVKKYHILEISNPFMAYQSLLTDLKAGLFVPFRIVIFEDYDGNINVSLINPEGTAGFTENMVFELVAAEASEKLKKAIGSLEKPT